MKILILKLNATGDVVRTTPLLRCLEGEITWITARNNIVLLEGLGENLRSLCWEDRGAIRGEEYDLVINLEDEVELAAFVRGVPHRHRFGAYMNENGTVTYTEESRAWFDMSLISQYGKEKADALKFQNRRTYQELIFQGLGFDFSGEKYVLPEPLYTDLTGDIAIAPVAGAVWPMKNWAFYSELKVALESEGLKVNILPKRSSLLEHLGDVRNHRCLVGGDSLPMHFALGTDTRCVSLFTCTSPWEIYDYSLQTKIVSPLLGDFFYQRGFDPRATEAIALEEVYEATVRQYLAGSEDSGSGRLPAKVESLPV
ncbi:MAG: glycosyltransferase family 9 protein [Verrucomicrobia bacterium]|nr:glycosyltransferase family 9 protein [Verrucomicrobiota bacterium]